MPPSNPIDLTSLWTDPFWRWHILFSIVFWAALLVMSYRSVRLLSRLPDFEHKDEMLWGARWWVLIFLGIIVLSGIIWYAGLRLTGHFSPLTIYVPCALVLIMLHYGLGSWRMHAPGAVLTYWQLKRKKKTVTKEVVYYIARTDTDSVTLSDEHRGCEWLNADAARERLTFENSRRVLQDALAVIEGG